MTNHLAVQTAEGKTRAQLAASINSGLRWIVSAAVILVLDVPFAWAAATSAHWVRWPVFAILFVGLLTVLVGVYRIHFQVEELEDPCKDDTKV